MTAALVHEKPILRCCRWRPALEPAVRMDTFHLQRKTLAVFAFDSFMFRRNSCHLQPRRHVVRAQGLELPTKIESLPDRPWQARTPP